MGIFICGAVFRYTLSYFSYLYHIAANFLETPQKKNSHRDFNLCHFLPLVDSGSLTPTLPLQRF